MAIRSWQAPTLVILAATFGCGARAPVEPPPADPIASLNAVARASYRNGKVRALAGLDPVIVVGGDELLLIHHGQRFSSKKQASRYHDQKTLAHVPLALEGIVGNVEGPLDRERLGELRELRERIDPAMREFLARGHPREVVERSRQIVARSTAFIDELLSKRALHHDEFVAYARAIGPLLLASAADSARSELDAIHRQTMAWKGSIPAADWAKLHVVVQGSHMARARSLQMQYFQRLLGEDEEGGRIIYAESVWGREQALDLLATHVIDADLAESFFGDRSRMHRDLLSDAAAEYIPTLLP